jgi:nucleotide-binding universal stress UspA family protein
VDGSEGSVHALRWALNEARLRHDTVDVIHGWHVPYVSDTAGMIPYPGELLQESAESVLADVLAAVASDAEGVTVTSHIEQGTGAPILIEASKHADLLVVGRRGHGGFVSLVMGSVAQHVAAHACCPVVIVAVD